MAQLRPQADKLARLNTQVVVVSFSKSDEYAQQWLDEVGVDFPLVLDPEREVYEAYQLDSSLLRSWGPKTLWFYFKRFLRGEDIHGLWGDPHQLGGDFIIDADGVLRFVYRSHDPTDRPAVDTLLSVVEQLNEEDTTAE